MEIMIFKKNKKKSNCLIEALKLRKKIKGSKIYWVWFIQRRPYPHVFIEKSGYTIDFWNFNKNQNIFSVFYKGQYRISKLKFPKGIQWGKSQKKKKVKQRIFKDDNTSI